MPYIVFADEDGDHFEEAMQYANALMDTVLASCSNPNNFTEAMKSLRKAISDNKNCEKDGSQLHSSKQSAIFMCIKNQIRTIKNLPLEARKAFWELLGDSLLDTDILPVDKRFIVNFIAEVMDKSNLTCISSQYVRNLETLYAIDEERRDRQMFDALVKVESPLVKKN